MCDPPGEHGSRLRIKRNKMLKPCPQGLTLILGGSRRGLSSDATRFCTRGPQHAGESIGVGTKRCRSYKSPLLQRLKEGARRVPP